MFQFGVAHKRLIGYLCNNIDVFIFGLFEIMILNKIDFMNMIVSKCHIFPIDCYLHSRIHLLDLSHKVVHLLVSFFFCLSEFWIIVKDMELCWLWMCFLWNQIIPYSSIKRHPECQKIGSENLSNVLQFSSVVDVNVFEIFLPELNEWKFKGWLLRDLCPCCVVGYEEKLTDKHTN